MVLLFEQAKRLAAAVRCAAADSSVGEGEKEMGRAKARGTAGGREEEKLQTPGAVFCGSNSKMCPENRVHIPACVSGPVNYKVKRRPSFSSRQVAAKFRICPDAFFENPTIYC